MKKIIVLANDAGGAEILSALVRREFNNYHWLIFVPEKSPAQAIFTSKGLKKIIKLRSLSRDITSDILKHEPDWVLYNCGWRRLFPLDVKKLRQKHIKTMFVLDHWQNYKQRFGWPQSGWQKNLPDLIAVTDKAAMKLAKKDGLDNLVKLNNYYISDLQTAYKKLPRSTNHNLLFISQYIKTHDNQAFEYFGQYEPAILETVIESLKNLRKNFKLGKFVIRAHPSSSLKSFDCYRRQSDMYNMEVVTMSSEDLLVSIKKSSLVIGLDSTAMFVAYILGKPVAVILPPGVKVVNVPLPRRNQVKHVDLINKLKLLDLAKSGNNLLYQKYPLAKILK